MSASHMAAASSAEPAQTEEPAQAQPVAAALSDGLLQLVEPMVETCDSSIKQAVDSQAKLSQQLDRVAAELQAFLGASQLPSFAPYAQRLADVRRRANSASSTLALVQQRLTRVEEMAQRLAAEESLTLSRAPNPPSGML